LLSPSELEMIAKQLGGTIAVLLKPVLADTKRLADRVEELEAQLKSLPSAEQLVEEVAKSLPVPKDGTSVTVEDLRPVVVEVAKGLIAELPVPKDGVDGTSVDVAQVRSMVEEVAKSLPVPKDGRDALDINILPGIDFTKSYLRDTYATHDGGLWRAHATTEGERGWECVVDGVKSVEVEQIDERTVDITVSLASGKSTKKTMKVPVAIYQEVFDEKRSDPYVKGDMVTWGGSVWYCRVPETKSKPYPGNLDWKLAVKAGRDANNTVVRQVDPNATVKMK